LEKYFGFHCEKGDSMEPEINEGDIIIVGPYDNAMPGDYVVAKNDEEEATFKQYKIFDNTLVLHYLNPKYSDIVLNKDKYKASDCRRGDGEEEAA